MKLSTQPKTIWNRWIKSASLVVLALTSAALVTACGKKDGGGGHVPVGPGGYIVPGCNGCGHQFLTSGVGRSAAGLEELAVRLFGNTTIQAGHQMTYTGAVSGQGTLHLQRQVGLGGCYIPPGVYHLQSTQPGSFGADGAGRSVQMYLDTASGPAPLRVALNGWTKPAAPPAISVITGEQHPNKIEGVMRLYINNALCDEFYIY